MTPADMAALHAECFSTPRPWSATEFADLMASPHVFVQTQALGFVMGRVIAGEAEVLTLAVGLRARRRGIGRELMTGFLNHARLAAQSAFLEVAENNHAAIALYQSCGFKPSGRRRGYYAAPVGAAIDALIMTCPLLPQSLKI
jgi:ribosomal-protein-alanine N-acetyltransferase